VLLYVYRLRQSGARMGRLALASQPPAYGDFLFTPWPHEWYGRQLMLAKVTERGTSRELLPHLEHARVVRVRTGLLVAGNEVIAWASKSKGQRYPQTWLCSPNLIAPDSWPPPPRSIGRLGFDIADDDLE
jgi:hypothetical protein